MMFRPAIYRNRDFWSDPFEDFDAMFPTFWNNGSLEKCVSNFSTDVIEKDGNYILQAELPGFNKEDINIDLKNDILTITAAHSEEKKEEDDQKYLRRERRTSSYSRSFKVQNIKAEDISASYRNGILEVTFPKRLEAPETEAKRIEIGE